MIRIDAVQERMMHFLAPLQEGGRSQHPKPHTHQHYQPGRASSSRSR